MITDLDREKYRQEYAALELRSQHPLFDEFNADFVPSQRDYIGGGAAGRTYRFKASIDCVALTARTGCS